MANEGDFVIGTHFLQRRSSAHKSPRWKCRAELSSSLGWFNSRERITFTQLDAFGPCAKTDAVIFSTTPSTGRLTLRLRHSPKKTIRRVAVARRSRRSERKRGPLDSALRLTRTVFVSGRLARRPPAEWLLRWRHPRLVNPRVRCVRR